MTDRITLTFTRRTLALSLAGLAAVAGLTFSLSADADHHAEGEAALKSESTITLMQAKTAIDAARAKAEEMGVKMNIAVVDAGANLVAFERMDGAWLGSTDIAQRKARTARFFDMPTGEVGKLSQPGGPLYQIEASNTGLITFPGGLPITNADGQIVGAIGVSGDSVENDRTVAQAGVDALK